LENDELDDEQDQESQVLIPTEEQVLIPTEQDTILFNGKPLVVVRLPDGRPGVVLRWICENLHIGQKAQVERIKRTEVIAGDLVYVQVQTRGGFQTMATLVLDSVPYWLATIETRRMEKDDPKRLEILAYQRRAVAALFTWASSQKAIAAPSNLVPSEPIVEPIRPAPEASVILCIFWLIRTLADGKGGRMKGLSVDTTRRELFCLCHILQLRCSSPHPSWSVSSLLSCWGRKSASSCF
jgi:P22_AR N-terminal domain